MKTQQAEVGVWDQYDTQWKSEVQGGLYPDDGDKGRLLFSYRIAGTAFEKSIILQFNNYQQGGSVALPYRERKGMMQAACVPSA